MSTWIYFRSTSWEQANYLFKTLFRFDKSGLGLRENYYLLVFIFAISTFLFGLIKNSTYFQKIINNYFLKILGSSIALTLALIFINRQSAFIYFQF